MDFSIAALKALDLQTKFLIWYASDRHCRFSGLCTTGRV